MDELLNYADFGLETLGDLVSRTRFPWLMSNVVDRETGGMLADGVQSHVLEWEGRRVGLIGVVEQEWLDTLATINTDQVNIIINMLYLILSDSG